MPEKDGAGMDIKAILGGLAFAFMWSSAFTSARIIVTNAPPLTVSAIRFLLAGLIVLAIARIAGQSMRLNAQQWKLTIVFGICQNALYLGLNFVAMQWVEASLAAIIAASLPLWVGLSGAGIAGVMLIMGTRLSAGVDPVGVVLCVLGALALTFATLAVRGASSGGNLLTVVGFQMLIGSAALWIPALLLETWQVNWSPLVIGAFFYTIFVPGILATILWFWLIGRIGATRAATFHFLNPFLGVVIAAALLGEELGWQDAVGVAIITAGILAVQVSKIRV
jgi:drug/metabolite transporter (DMT)-like permease